MSVDERSAKSIATLRPKARPWFEYFWQICNDYVKPYGLRVVITSGNRTWAEQDALFAKGRTKPGPVVTNARGGSSNHNYGIAVDITLFKGNAPVWESPYYKALGGVGKSMGLEWGGDWTSIRDEPHYQLRLGKTVGQLRALVNSGGWSAVDALIRDFKTTSETRPPAEPELEKVEVYFDDLDDGKPAVRFDIPAWLIDSKTWVGVNSFCDYFGGDYEPATADMTPQIAMNGERKGLGTRAIGSTVAARFDQVNALLGLPFSFDGKANPKRLTIHRDAEEYKP